MIDSLIHQMHDPLTMAVPFFLVTAVIEVTALYLLDNDGERFAVRDSLTSFLMGSGALTLGLAFRAASLVLYVWLYVEFAPWHLPADNPITWVGVFIAVDVLWYTYHRSAHRVRMIWAAHQAHHNSNYFNTSTALRQKWNQWFDSLIWIPLPLLGVPPWMIQVFFSINLIYQFFTHTEAIGKLWRPIEFVMNTPSHHRVHHGSDQIYLDRNYGGVLIIWDRMFGTYQEELHRPTYGLTTPIYSNNLLKLQFHEYAAVFRDVRHATDWKARIGFLVGPPGWQPMSHGAVAQAPVRDDASMHRDFSQVT